MAASVTAMMAPVATWASAISHAAGVDRRHRVRERRERDRDLAQQRVRGRDVGTRCGQVGGHQQHRATEADQQPQQPVDGHRLVVEHECREHHREQRLEAVEDARERGRDGL
jgi:hypothetical protein